MLSIRSILLAGAFVLLTNGVSLADPPPWANGNGPPPWANGNGPPPWAASASRVQSVPIPGTEILFGLGFVGLMWAHSRWLKGKFQEKDAEH
jgi:hypothetical protein